jgi:osmoprotectant transport system permease protein
MIHKAIDYIVSNPQLIADSVTRHLFICAIGLAICVAVGVPLGFGLSKYPKFANGVISSINGIRMIPVIASFFILIPLVGLGITPAIIVLCFNGLYMIIVCTQRGIDSVNRSVVESAESFGMNKLQIALGVEFPLALPFIVNGIRIVTIELLAGAALAAYVGAGGIGDIILWGIGTRDFAVTLVGGGLVILLVVFFDRLLALVQKRVSANI